jgi:Fur family ferric uptake transcriptional regulator
MTAPNVTAATPVTTLAGAVEELRRQGLRLSAARRLVLEALDRSDRPLSADEIAQGAEGLPASDLASVYRNLETLERTGIVRHMHLGHGPGLYALAGEKPRDHLVCESCGSKRVVGPGELDDVRDAIRARFGFEARFNHFPLFGLCEGCVQRSASDVGAGGKELHA